MTSCIKFLLSLTFNLTINFKILKAEPVMPNIGLIIDARGSKTDLKAANGVFKSLITLDGWQRALAQVYRSLLRFARIQFGFLFQNWFQNLQVVHPEVGCPNIFPVQEDVCNVAKFAGFPCHYLIIPDL